MKNILNNLYVFLMNVVKGSYTIYNRRYYYCERVYKQNGDYGKCICGNGCDLPF